MVRINDYRGCKAVGVFAVLVQLLFACGGQNDRLETEAAALEQEGEFAMGEPVMLFDTLVHDFGTIIEGEQVVCYFEYTNSGEGNLMITGVETSCGCTIPNWNRELLKPGAKETLELIFDASGRSGQQLKQITVKSNAKNQVVRLTIRARVINSVS